MARLSCTKSAANWLHIWKIPPEKKIEKGTPIQKAQLAACQRRVIGYRGLSEKYQSYTSFMKLIASKFQKWP